MIITAGETKVLRFQRLDGDRQVITDVTDEMYCTVKRNFDDEDFIFQKTIGDGQVHCVELLLANKEGQR